jgi:hypothetical protein
VDSIIIELSTINRELRRSFLKFKNNYQIKVLMEITREKSSLEILLPVGIIDFDQKPEQNWSSSSNCKNKEET